MWIRWVQHLAEHWGDTEMKRAPPGIERCQAPSECIQLHVNAKNLREYDWPKINMTYMRKQGSMTLSESTSCHQFSFLSLSRYPHAKFQQILSCSSSASPPQTLFHRKCWGWEGHGVKLIWKTTARSAFQKVSYAAGPGGLGGVLAP